MRRRIVAATLVVIAGILAACSDASLPTAPVTGSALKLSIAQSGCVDPSLSDLTAVDTDIKNLINGLFLDQNQRSSTLTMWENLKKDKLESRPLQNHIDNLSKWTLEHFYSNELSDPDGAGNLNTTTGSMRLLDLVFRCADQTPTQVPTPPAGVDAIFQVVAPSTTEQKVTSSFADAAALIPGGALDDNTLVAIVRQPSTVVVNSPFPKVSRTVDVALAGGRLKSADLSVLFCTFENIPHGTSDRRVVAHQKRAPTAVVGENVEYLRRASIGTFECPEGIGAAPRIEKNPLKRGLFYAASLAGKALSVIGPKTAYAGHGAIGGLISFDASGSGDLSPMVVVDAYVETAIVDPTTVIPTTPTPITQASPPIIAPKIYGEALTFTAQLRVANIPACANDPTAVACTWIGQPITPTLTGMPALGPLNISVAFPGQPTPPEALTKEIDAGGNAAFSFTHLNADANQNANFTFLPTFNNLSQAPNFGGSTATSQYTITPRPLTVTANALSWEYGSPPMKPAPLANEVLVTGTFTDDQVQYGENVTPSYSTTQNAMTEVGSYTDALVADVIFGAGVRAANYAVSKTNATLTVTKAPLTVTAASPSRLYGDPNPALTGTVVGIKNNDAYTATYATLATASSSVAGSPYAITAAITGDRLPRNYNITLNPGQLTVNSRPLTVNVVAPAHVPYGSPFTLGTTNNAVLADGFTISFTGAPASVPAPVGSYTIGATVTGANVTGPKPNYAPVTVNTATMIVDPPPTATPDLQFKFTEQTSVDDVLFDRYNFTVTNRASFPASLFEPRAGATTCISKTRVDFFDAETNQYIYGFCGLGSPDNLDNIWFAVPRWTQPPAGVYLKFIDQTTNAVLFTSNTVQLFGPLFTNFPRTVALDWAPIAGAASYTVQVDYCESWASPDWRSCNAWLPRQTLTVAAPATSVSHTFLGDQPGRWRVTAVSVTGAPLGTTEYKYFNYRTAP